MTAADEELIAKCLKAAVDGPYLSDDDEFEAIMGIDRAQARATLEAWPEPAAHGQTDLVVNNALNNLLGYPHKQWRALSRELGAGEDDVAHALMRWRGEDHRAGGGQGYFDAMM